MSVRKEPYLGITGTSSELWKDLRTQLSSYDDDYISQPRYPKQPETLVWDKVHKNWSGDGFRAPWEKDKYWPSKKTPYFQPAPVYSPNVIDEELQRILKALGLSNTTPAKDVPTVTETMPAGTPPDTDPISRAIAEYYRDQAA